MRKFIAPALLAVIAMSTQALAQSATDTQPDASRVDRSASQTDPSAQNSRTQSETQRSQLSQAGGQQASQGNALEKHIAVCLTLGNQEEIQLGQFAQDRAQHPQVKQFAQMMVEEHQQANSKIQQAMPEVASMNLELTAQGGQGGAQGATAGAGSRTQSSTAGNQRSSATGAAGQGGQQEMVQFAKDVKQNCLQLAMQELGRKQGAEFDKAYIGQQLVAHMNMLAELRAAQKHASGELQPIIQQGTQMTEHHMAQARQIMEQLAAGNEGTGGPEQAQRQDAQPNRQ
jgi:predicted outer membrane protein